MTMTDLSLNECIPLFISQSTISTEVNNTGTWRFVRPIYQEKTAPCSQACPAGQDIPRIEMLAKSGMFEQAWQTILLENPLPAVCGRVCFHPCERACNRQDFDEAVAVHCLERFIGDKAIAENYPVPDPSELEASAPRIFDKHIAIAGSGPAGLSAAWFLSRLGYRCTIFEADIKPGGLLRWGIPEYRLPKRVLKAEIARIIAQGVQIQCKTPIDESFLKNATSRFDALFIACGYCRPIRMNIAGEELMQDGLKFLHDIRIQGHDCQLPGNTAAVIGGGNSAIDVARSLMRLGIQATIIYRRRREDMPAFAHEIEMAIREGVKLVELSAPIRIEAKNSGLQMTLQKMKAIPSDQGKAQIVPDGNLSETLSVHQIFRAIGAEPGENWMIPGNAELLKIENDLPIVFGGDLVTPTKSVTDAIGSGKQAAMILDTFFRQGRDAIEQKLAFCRIGSGSSLSMEIYLGGKRKDRSPSVVAFKDLVTDYFQPVERTPLPLSRGEYDEVEQTISSEAAEKESARCFNCGICNECDNCRVFCPEVAVIADEHREINLKYCKGCGICVTECPRNAMSLEEEVA